MKYNIALNVRAAIKYEQLTNKSFLEIDYSSEDDIKNLLYACMSAKNIITRKEFEGLYSNEKHKKGMSLEVMRQVEQMGDFSGKKKYVGNSGDTSDYLTQKISDVVEYLIGYGHNIIDCQINELQIYLNAVDKKKREDMESQRLWTYLSILPHVDAKKIKTPSDLYPFPWEIEAKQKELEKEVNENMELFNDFMSGKITFENN